MSGTPPTTPFEHCYCASSGCNGSGHYVVTGPEALLALLQCYYCALSLDSSIFHLCLLRLLYGVCIPNTSAPPPFSLL